MNKGIFLDRDGVINKLVHNPDTGEYESPHYEKDLELCPGVLPALKRLKEEGYLLFLVSNQPSYAKGKTSLENIKAIHQRFHGFVYDYGVEFTEYFYCYHHPRGIVPEYTCYCKCRKPEPYFLLKAKEDHGLDMDSSWLIGDRDSDIFCGQSAGVRTILINGKYSEQKTGESHPDFIAYSLEEAVTIIQEKQTVKEKEKMDAS